GAKFYSQFMLIKGVVKEAQDVLEFGSDLIYMWGSHEIESLRAKWDCGHRENSTIFTLETAGCTHSKRRERTGFIDTCISFYIKNKYIFHTSIPQILLAYGDELVENMMVCDNNVGRTILHIPNCNLHLKVSLILSLMRPLSPLLKTTYLL
ncbi:hypothetical protein ACJX0J_014034, partial [Zea mays]